MIQRPGTLTRSRTRWQRSASTTLMNEIPETVGSRIVRLQLSVGELAGAPDASTALFCA
jgi:hypothetical protein